MKTTKFLLTTWLKVACQRALPSSGFTLVELLVAALMSFLIIAPLMGLMLNILETERREQAKGKTEQELQVALDYIARDLQQAVYIYDRAGIAGITGSYSTTICPSASYTGSCSQLPTSADQIPVLAFWKRQLVEDAIPLEEGDNCDLDSKKGVCDDALVYSLVTYYLDKDDSNTWSSAARISRFEIRDGVKDPATGSYVYDLDPSKNQKGKRYEGFNPFDLSEGTLTDQMNKWKKAFSSDEDYNISPQVLVDFIDQSTSGVPSEACPTDPEWSQVPDYSSSYVNDQFKTYSFYACVNSAKNIARLFLRGNALAGRSNQNYAPSYSSSQSEYFPRTQIEVRGSSSLK